MAKKIQRMYRKHYDLKVSAANLIKKYMRRHIYEKKNRKFVYDLQKYSNKMKIEVYIRTILAHSQF